MSLWKFSCCLSLPQTMSSSPLFLQRSPSLHSEPLQNFVLYKSGIWDVRKHHCITRAGCHYFLKSANAHIFVSPLAENYYKCSLIRYLLCHLYFDSLKDRWCLLPPIFFTCKLLKVRINDSSNSSERYVNPLYWKLSSFFLPNASVHFLAVTAAMMWCHKYRFGNL